MIQVLKCNTCGAVLEVLAPGHGVTCCGQPMKELNPNTEDAAQEKHVPVVEVNGNTVTIKVGSIEHPMLPEHYIGHIWLETTDGVQRKDLKPEEKPEAVFVLGEGVTAVAAYEYCNLHGFWKKEL